MASCDCGRTDGWHLRCCRTLTGFPVVSTFDAELQTPVYYAYSPAAVRARETGSVCG